MAKYLARVEISDADSEQYDELHDCMENYGFSRVIVGDDGIEYALPTGLYVAEKTADISDVLVKIRSIADPLSSDEASVFVCIYGEFAAFLSPEE